MKGTKSLKQLKKNDKPQMVSFGPILQQHRKQKLHKILINSSGHVDLKSNVFDKSHIYTDYSNRNSPNLHEKSITKVGSESHRL